jgi:Family of unknown function (DUF6932)
MIPPFNQDGVLPPGVHQATLEEVASLFGHSSEIRRVQMESVRWMVELALRAGADRIVLNGSFVTDIIETNDVDCVLLFTPGRQRDAAAFQELMNGLPFMDIAIVEQLEFNEFVGEIFAADRFGTSKGMIEVVQ